VASLTIKHDIDTRSQYTGQCDEQTLCPLTSQLNTSKGLNDEDS
jgi:hypothetical protein